MHHLNGPGGKITKFDISIFCDKFMKKTVRLTVNGIFDWRIGTSGVALRAMP
jgi:hypothetical protein